VDDGGKRHIGCHGTCEDYIQEKAKYEEEKNRIEQARSYQNEHMNYVKDIVERRRRTHHR
jgi:hypothetical protein